jgi:hypothetical protein
MDFQRGFDYVHGTMPKTDISLSEHQVYYISAIVYA